MLPPEILGNIFLSIIVETFTRPLKQEDRYVSATASAVHLSSVSAYWRSVALSTPRIWSYITLLYGRYIAQSWLPHPPLIVLSLARAQNIPLHLDITAPPMLKHESPPAWDALAEQLMAATGVLKVTSGPQVRTRHPDRIQIAADTALSRLLLKPSPRLTDLKYRLKPRSIRVTDSQELHGKILPHAPMLVSLELVYFDGLKLDTLKPEVIRDLRRLTWRNFGSYLRVAEVLNATRRLQHLELGCDYLSNTPIGVSKPSTASELVSLCCDASFLPQLDHIRVPNICTLKIGDNCNFDPTYLARFLDSTPYLALQHLVLPPTDYNEAAQGQCPIVPLFKYMPNVQTLSMQWLSNEEDLLVNLAQPENVGLLPNLQKIIYRDAQVYSLEQMAQYSGLETISAFKLFRARRAAVSETCNTTSRLPFTLELNVNRDASVVVDLCDLLGTYISTIRIIGSRQHLLPATLRLEIRDGLRQTSRSWNIDT